MDRLEFVLRYHERTKHHPHRFARSLGWLDWDSQPSPYRRYEGAAQLPLDVCEPAGPAAEQPTLAQIGQPGAAAPRPLDRRAVSQLLRDALGLSAWKQSGRSRWALRANPSSGNLHPTEGYLLAGPVPGLAARPAVYHYAPYEHALELRLELEPADWAALTAGLPRPCLLLGLSTIPWRESWKYGERAFRYCELDLGHALGSVAFAAAALGWRARLLEPAAEAALAELFGTFAQSGPEAEQARALVVVYPADRALAPAAEQRFAVPEPLRARLRAARWHGRPNTLSPWHHDWPVIEQVAAATARDEPPPRAWWQEQPAGGGAAAAAGAAAAGAIAGGEPAGSEEWFAVPLRRLIQQRRSCLELDGRTGLKREPFYLLLGRLLRRPHCPPLDLLPWPPQVDLVLFVHRVAELPRGLYALVREPARAELWRAALRPDFRWERPEGCPDKLPLFLLARADVRAAARQASCEQWIASEGAFALAMLAPLRQALQAFGPWFYRRLHWEAGLVGQVLYLGAEALGLRGTGMGCFFDEVTHRLLGIRQAQLQDLYHFTMGGALEDPRLQTHPPYAHLERR